MKIAGVRIFYYSLPLNKPLTAGASLTKREGLLVQIRDQQGGVGWGEAAPLPPLSSETLTTAKDQLLALKESLVQMEVPISKRPLTSVQNFLKELEPLLDSVRFACETALLNCLTQNSTPLAGLINKDFFPQVMISGLLAGPLPEVREEAAALVAQGYQSVKLKVGGDVKEEIAKVKAVSDVTKDKALLRLDANRAWTLSEAVKFGRGVGLETVEYIEEPLTEPKESANLYAETMIPVALDESLKTLPLEEIRHIEGVDVLVVKPTLWGGICRTLALMDQAKALGLRVVISSSFESGLGILTLANLAAACSRNVAAGLDTLKWFKQDLLDGIAVEKGYLNLSRLPAQLIPNPKRIEEITA